MTEIVWIPISQHPQTADPVLLYSKTHGAIEGWFSKGEWEEHFEYGREYTGDVWVLGDDLTQVEIEWITPTEFWSGDITHYATKIEPPVQPPEETVNDAG